MPAFIEAYKSVKEFSGFENPDKVASQLSGWFRIFTTEGVRYLCNKTKTE
tara:strand:- start:632 stop:781 length:150 start_codon:yes stop_codon:yes gene_type:complete